MTLNELQVMRQDVELCAIKTGKFDIHPRDMLELLDDLEDALEENVELAAEVNELLVRIDELSGEADEIKEKYEDLKAGVTGVVERLEKL